MSAAVWHLCYGVIMPSLYQWQNPSSASSHGACIGIRVEHYIVKEGWWTSCEFCPFKWRDWSLGSIGGCLASLWPHKNTGPGWSLSLPSIFGKREGLWLFLAATGCKLRWTLMSCNTDLVAALAVEPFSLDQFTLLHTKEFLFLPYSWHQKCWKTEKTVGWRNIS